MYEDETHEGARLVAYPRRLGGNLAALRQILNGPRRCQGVEATRSRSKASRGVRNPRLARGRSLSSSAMEVR